MVYYRITFYTNRKDLQDRLPRYGGMKGINWLQFKGDDKGMQVDEEREDEALAVQILMQNLQNVETELVATSDLSRLRHLGKKERYVKHEADLVDLLHGQYEAVLVQKYLSDVDLRPVVGG